MGRETMAKCVMRQLKQLEESPIKGVAAAPKDGDLREIHCTVVGPEGTAYEGVPLHFVLEIQPEYPVTAPHAYFVTDITYHGGAVMKDNKGRTQVCLNIFGNFAFIHTEWATAGREGWSSGYTIETVLVQMQSVMHDDFLSTDRRHVEQTRRSAQGLRCTCGHTAAKPYPPIPEASAPPRAAVVDGPQAAVPAPVCYATHTTLAEEDVVLGIGVAVDRRGGLSTPAETLSLEGFRGGVRRSSDNAQGFEHLLPLSFCAEHHRRLDGKKGNLAELREAVQGICRSAGQAGNAELGGCADFPTALVKVCGLLMTGMVVEVMKLENGAASDRFIDTYYQVLHTLRCVDAETDRAVSRHAREKIIAPFVAGRTSKKDTPNLGVLLAVLPLAGLGWADVRERLAEENDARNVFWVVEGNRASPGPHPELANPENGTAAERCEKMFRSTAVSRKLVCFQKKFSGIAGSLDAAALDATYGSVDDAAKQAIKAAHRDVAAMKTWDEHYAYLDMGWKETGCEFHRRRLVKAVHASKALGYHGHGGKGGGKGSKGGKGGKGGKGKGYWGR